MRNEILAHAVVCALLSAGLLTGCNEDPGAENGDGDHIPSPLPKSTGDQKAYPPPPYGVTAGSTIQAFAFQGYPNSKVKSDALELVTLSDFYNPHADDPTYEPASPDEDDRLYPPGSPYGAGTKKPRALLVDIASVWCGPCNEEAKTVLPGLHAKYKPCGGEFLFQLVEGPSSGTPATEQNLHIWATKYKLDYPATLDPGRQLSVLYGGGVYPDEVIIDTRTMQIIKVISGVPDDAFWNTFESQLDRKCLQK